MTETIKIYKKYPVFPLSANSIREKYTNGFKCSLYLEGKLDIFEKS